MSVSPYVRKKSFWGNLIFSAPIQDRYLKFLVKIPMTYAHLSVIWGVRLIPRF